MKELKIDPEFRDLLPPLIDDEYKKLEKNIVENGFDKNFPIMEWHGFIADGHNRYKICQDHNITDYVVGTLAYETKEEVMEWMLDIQLGRRNLSPIQRIAITEKYRPIYERQALANKQFAMFEARKNNSNNKSEQLLQNSSTTVQTENKIDVRAKLADIAGVSTDTYSKGKKILDSNNEEVKQAVISGEMSINAGYNRIRTNKKEETNNKLIPTTSISSPKPIIENGVILIEEKTDDDKMMNDIARRLKSGKADLSKINNESELNNFESIINNAINSAMNYFYVNIELNCFTREDLYKLREIICVAKDNMNQLIKKMEELLNE